MSEFWKLLDDDGYGTCTYGHQTDVGVLVRISSAGSEYMMMINDHQINKEGNLESVKIVEILEKV